MDRKMVQRFFADSLRKKLFIVLIILFVGWFGYKKFFASKTAGIQYQTAKAEKGTKDDLKTGERVAVFGQENTDGSVTAQNIQLNPQMERMGSSRMPQ